MDCDHWEHCSASKMGGVSSRVPLDEGLVRTWRLIWFGRFKRGEVSMEVSTLSGPTDVSMTTDILSQYQTLHSHYRE